MKVSMIAALTNQRVIGYNGKIPWHISNDLKRFKSITQDHVVIMGRNTFQSMGSKPLPKRTNIILTTDLSYWKELFERDNAIVTSNFPTALLTAKVVSKLIGKDEIFVIGGETLYKQALPAANKLYLSFVKQECKGDTYFPEVDFSLWNLIQEEDDPDYTFKVYEKKT